MTTTKAVTLIFPHQLFKKHPALKAGREIYLVEEYLFFRQFNFNKQKLVLHRASMKFYESHLVSKGYQVKYIDSTSPESGIIELIKKLKASSIDEIHFADPVDNYLQRRIKETAETEAVGEVQYETPYFLNPLAEADSFFSGKKSYFQADYYIWQRKKHKVLLEADGKPLGGKWSLDADNRGRFPTKEFIPPLSTFAPDKFTTEARSYVDKNFADNYGSSAAPFSTGADGKTTNAKTGNGREEFYAVTFDQADQALSAFLKDRFRNFGIYEDAMVSAVPVLYHSMLSAMINIGLLTPREVIDEAISYASMNEIPLNSIEGFIRQIMGWREFIRIVYEKEGSFQRKRNYWGFTRKIPAAFWTGDTGIQPIDIVIKKSLQNGYAHHIERLMVIGNFFLLCEFDPDEVYRWFMEMYVDAYDWVMVPNVYGMTQFADGGLMTTKPYISGSNYLLKMGNWEKGNWQAIWDGLFWRFMHVHRSFFLNNPRLGMLVHMYDKMDDQKKNDHLKHSTDYLTSLDLQ